MSPVRKNVEMLDPYIPGEQSVDSTILKLNTNENPYPPSPRIRNFLQNYSPDPLRLYPDSVCGKLRTSLAGLHQCDIDQVFVGNGSDEVLALCIRAFVERNQEVGYFVPSYSLYPVLAGIEDVGVYEVPLSETFTWQNPNPRRASLFFITNPNAPTSILFDRSAMESFIDEIPGIVVIDEAYVDFSCSHCLDLALARENVIVTRSLSKSYSLAGIRVGYAVGPPSLMGALGKIKDSYNVNGLSQQIALEAVEDRAYFCEIIDRIVKTRVDTIQALRSRDFVVLDSETNFLWAKPPSRNAEDWFASLRADKILIRHFPALATREWLRISIGSDKGMERFLDAVDRCLM